MSPKGLFCIDYTARFDRRCDTEVHEVRRLEVIDDGVGRRRWSAERKGEIVAESMQPGVVVSAVACRHDLTPQQLFAWRHDAEQGRLALPGEAMSFVPAPANGQVESHLDCAVIKAPDDVQSKPLPRFCARCRGSARGESGAGILPGGQARVFVATKPVDFGKSLDGLSAVVQAQLKLDPFGRAIFVFRAKRAAEIIGQISDRRLDVRQHRI